MEEKEEMLESRKWAKDCLRVNITEPDKIIQRGKVKISLIQSELLPKKEVALREAVQACAPEWWGDDTQVLVNKNVQCKKHIDANDGRLCGRGFAFRGRGEAGGEIQVAQDKREDTALERAARGDKVWDCSV